MANRTEYYNEYIKEHYTSIGIYCQDATWKAFKEACGENGKSMASAVRDIMEKCMEGGEANG